MSADRRERAALLAHDVGKYVARIARNVPEGADVPPPLVPMLARDLFERPGGGRPSLHFHALASGDDSPRVVRVAALLAEVDALEPAVREGDLIACKKACSLAREIERELRAHASEVAA